MEFNQLKALVTVAEVGSVTRAAELLELVQPAVTRQIRALEAEVGVVLFERTSRGMRPTEAGAIMVDRARQVLEDLKHARMAVRPRLDDATGTVTLGLLESTADLLAAPVAAITRRDHPGIRLHLVAAASGHLQQWLDRGTLDVSLLPSATATPALHAHPLVRDNLWAVAPAEAGLTPHCPIGFSEVARHPLVLPSPDHGLRALVDRAATYADVMTDVAVESDSLRTQKALVRAGLGWSIMPGVALTEDLAAHTLSAAPLRDPDVWRTVVLATRRAASTPPAVRAVAGVVTRQAKAAVRQGMWPAGPEHAPTRSAQPRDPLSSLVHGTGR